MPSRHSPPPSQASCSPSPCYSPHCCGRQASLFSSSHFFRSPHFHFSLTQLYLKRGERGSSLYVPAFVFHKKRRLSRRSLSEKIPAALVFASLCGGERKNHHFSIICLDDTGGGYLKMAVDNHVRRVTQLSEHSLSHYR